MTKAVASQLKPGDSVRTPSGAQAEVVAVYPDADEALVEWTTGDRARFRLGLLKRVPPTRVEEGTP